MALKFFKFLHFKNDVDDYTPFPVEGTDGQVLSKYGDSVRWIGMNIVDPINTVRMGVDTPYDSAENMSDYFGGTWVQISQGKTIYGAGTNENNNIEYTVGTDVSAGLPNIKGVAKFRASSYGSSYYATLLDNPTGVFTKSRDTSQGDTKSIRDQDSKYDVLTLNANKYNNIYKDDCNTVQPEATVLYIWKKTAL